MTRQELDALNRCAYAAAPFRYGDELYAIIDGDIKTVTVLHCLVGSSPEYFNIQTVTGGDTKCFSSMAFGKQLFTTREEAEAAL